MTNTVAIPEEAVDFLVELFCVCINTNELGPTLFKKEILKNGLTRIKADRDDVDQMIRNARAVGGEELCRVVAKFLNDPKEGVYGRGNGHLTFRQVMRGALRPHN